MTNIRKRALTDARLGRPPLPSMVEAFYTPCVEGELTAFEAHIEVDLAHAVMLAEQRLIEPQIARRLIQCLLSLRDQGRDSLAIDPGIGSLLLQIERHIEDSTGPEVAGVLQLARSRIDQFAATCRLYARDRLLDTIESLWRFQNVLRSRADEWIDVITPGYTHLQHAHPWNLAHYTLAHNDVFSRDMERLFQTYERVNLSALGGVALAGTSWPIDRQRTAALLGHSGIVRNSKDAGFFAMEFPSEIAGTLSLLLSGLNLLASELGIWCSWEFGLVELDAGLCGTSSAMPQKRNPYALERVRAIAGESIGWTATQLGLLKMPSPTECDMMFGTMRTASYFDATRWAILLMTDAMTTLKINREKMVERADENWGAASNLADVIVRDTGLDFRRAYHIVGTLVRRLSERGSKPLDAKSSDVDAAAVEVIGHSLSLGDAAVRAALDARNFLKTRQSEGSVGPIEVAKLIALARADSEATGARIEQEKKRLAHARAELGSAIDALR